jgi:hypothetical protein
MQHGGAQAAMDQTVHVLDCKYSSTTCHIRRLRIASFPFLQLASHPHIRQGKLCHYFNQQVHVFFRMFGSEA